MAKSIRAMILAAGRGSRMRPLTDTCPKPLVKVNGKPLIVYHLERLKNAGIEEVVINLHHLGDKIESYLGNGQQWGLNIVYSREEGVLEVGGGILNALRLLGTNPFIIVNGDVWTDFPFASLTHELKGAAHLILVENPEHHPKGDFAISASGLLFKSTIQPQFTYSGISVLSPALFEGCTQTAFRLSVVLEKAMHSQQLYGELYSGKWTDVGTLERLNQLEVELIADGHIR